MTFRVFAFLGAAVVGQAALIDFSADTGGAKPNGFSPVGHPNVSFSDTSGTDLSVSDFSPQSAGNGLGVFGDDVSRLQINFAVAISSLTIEFGNDDPSFSAPGDRAWLEVFDGVTSLGTFSVVMNRDDVLNQSISWSGASATQALFWYGDGAGAPINLIEIVDNIDYQENGVPEPGTWALMGLGLAGLALRRR